jgi:hypothetical protein
MSQETKKGCGLGLGIGFGIMSAPVVIGAVILIGIIILCVVCSVTGQITNGIYGNILTPVP